MNFDKILIEKEADNTRKKIGVDGYGIKDIFAGINYLGIDQIRYPFGKDVLLGFAKVHKGKRIIVSNSSEILAREIYTVAHELGHIIYDFSEGKTGIKTDSDFEQSSISEKRAFYFADCFLMPKWKILEYIERELKKKTSELCAFDIVRIQKEFNVSYSAIVYRLLNLRLITRSQKERLLAEQQANTSAKLFNLLALDDSLLRPTEVIKIPDNYLEYVISNYENDLIPFSSLQKALGLIEKDAKLFRKDESLSPEQLDLDDIFKEFDNESNT